MLAAPFPYIWVFGDVTGIIIIPPDERSGHQLCFKRDEEDKWENTSTVKI